MKYSNKLILTGLLPLLGLTACGDEDLGNENSEQPIASDVQYVGFRLNIIGNAPTRAEYTPGSERERAVSNVLIAFYDADGNFLQTDLIDKSRFDGENRFVARFDKTYSPAKVLAFINMPEIQSILEGLSYDAAIGKQLGTLGNGLAADSTCLMSSSSYMASGLVKTGCNIVSSVYAEFPEQALAGELLDLYVERLSAKAEVSLSPNLVIDIPNSNGAKVTFELQGYAINGTNRSSYLTKNISADFNNLGWAEPWNAESLHRSFWAKDCNYVEQGLANHDAYTYYKYSELVGATGKDNYCLENTSADLMDDLNIQNATHAIVIGRYTVEGIPTGTHLYLWNGRFLTAADFQQSVASLYPYYRAESGGGFEPLPLSSYKIYRQGVNGKDAAVVAIQLKGIEGSLYTLSSSGYETIDLDAANAQLLKVGNAIKYGHGKCYYAVPIRHLGETGQTGYYGVVRNHWYKVQIDEIKHYGNGIYNPGEEPGDPTPADPTIEPDDPSTDGSNTGEVIIPEPQKTDNNYYVGATIEILDWREVANDVVL